MKADAWGRAEQRLYRDLDDLLEDWAAEGINLVDCESWSMDTDRTKESGEQSHALQKRAEMS
ncbi:MAG: hypothetical protein GXY83_14885 [Rhodopirellula sp.]|nr:hypothetical protein [Rhodopirellula sp.]